MAYLGNNGQLVSEIVQANGVHIHSIDSYPPSAVLKNPEQSQRQTTLSSASSAHNSDLLPGLYVRVDPTQHIFQLLPVLDRVVLELNLAFLWPRIFRLVLRSPLSLYKIETE